MNTEMKMKHCLLAYSVLVMMSAIVVAPSAVGQGTAFTYQGRLTDNGQPANGRYDLRFILYSADVGGSQVGNILTNGNVLVSSGVFTTVLDFGAGGFAGSARWLEIGVRTNGSADAHTVLTPRQPVTATPYAIQAINATTAGSATNLSGMLPATNLTGTILDVRLSTNVALLSGGKLPDSVLSANVARANQVWLLGGNSGSSAGSQYVGTTDNQPLEFRVNNARALRLEPTGFMDTANVIGG